MLTAKVIVVGLLLPLASAGIAVTRLVAGRFAGAVLVARGVKTVVLVDNEAIGTLRATQWNGYGANIAPLAAAAPRAMPRRCSPRRWKRARRRNSMPT